jgi:hypothetical protein
MRVVDDGWTITILCTGCGLNYSPGLDTCPRCGYNPGHRPNVDYVMKACEGYVDHPCDARILWPEDDDLVLCRDCVRSLVAEVFEDDEA